MPRATVETLSVMKNPPVFARQANIAHGPQQVNNGVSPELSPSRAGNKETEQIKLLESRHGVDLGMTSTTGTGDSALEAVGILNRTTHSQGQGSVSTERRPGRAVA